MSAFLDSDLPPGNRVPRPLRCGRCAGSHLSRLPAASAHPGAPPGVALGAGRGPRAGRLRRGAAESRAVRRTRLVCRLGARHHGAQVPDAPALALASWIALVRGAGTGGCRGAAAGDGRRGRRRGGRPASARWRSSGTRPARSSGCTTSRATPTPKSARCWAAPPACRKSQLGRAHARLRELLEPDGVKNSCMPASTNC